MSVGEGVIPKAGDRLVPAVSAVLLASAFPPFHLAVPSFVGLVPLAVWIVDRGDDSGVGGDGGFAGAPGDAFRGGAWFGFLYFGLLFHWIASALIGFTWWAVPAYLAVVSALALCAGGFGWALHRMVRRGRVPLWLALPLAWTALEWLRAHAPGGVALPWLGLGTSLTAFPELVGSAELVGARGITFWLALLNGLVAEAILAARREQGSRRVWVWAAAFVLVLSIPAWWGYRRAADLPVRAVGSVVIVQPNVAQPVRLDPAGTIDSTLAALARLAPGEAAPRALPRATPDGRSGVAADISSAAATDLVIWPEATILGPVETDAVLRGRVVEAAARWGAPVLFGGIGRGSEGAHAEVPFNSAYLTASDGTLTDFRYDKHHLVPLVERVPFVPVAWVASRGVFGQYGQGKAWPLGQTRSGVRFGTLICFESAFAGHVRRFRMEGADILVNITNDAWFGREPWYTRTAALWQHPAHLVMRAIENRVGVARAANTGVSLFVDPRGRVYGQTPLFRPEVREATLYTSDVTTLYTRTGDLVGPLAVALTLMLLVGAGRTAPIRRL